MTVAPPQEVSTQAKLVFPAHRSLATQTVVEDARRESSRRGEERGAHARFVTGIQVVACRSPTTPVGSYSLLTAFRRRHPWNFQAKPDAALRQRRGMKMGPEWGILQGGAGVHRSWA
jgi:hypothetical protein